MMPSMLLRPPEDRLAPLTDPDEATRNLERWRDEGLQDANDSFVIDLAGKSSRQLSGPSLFGTTSGLSRAHAQSTTNMALQAAVLLYHHAPSVHYTQGTARWEGIAHHLKAWAGHFPDWADCSAAVTWELWNGLDHFHVRDVVNGCGWREGYTGTMLRHGRRMRAPFPGCAIIYGNGGTGKHTALYTGGGLVVSHGSEAGPFLLPWRYRSDVMAIISYIY